MNGPKFSSRSLLKKTTLQFVKTRINKNSNSNVCISFQLQNQSSYKKQPLLASGDIHSNPGPTKNPCSVCTKAVAKHHRRLNCDSCQKRCHINCGNVSVKDYNRLAVKTIYKWNCPSCLVSMQTTEPNDHINLGPAPPQLQPASEPTNNYTVHATFQSESDKLEIAPINIRSLLPSKNMVELFLDNSGIDILVVTETWLSQSIDPQATAIENYRCDLRQDRDGKKGGGIIIYYKSHLTIEMYHDLCLPASETNPVE